ncbi:hypothetical protein I5U56_14350 [Stenotrophomonas maltophilia]|uniref:hypothetical protein n=1 Tax=Stenotrophomonas forensis TaxID=2871169 RepID=UPI0018D2C875|nr:hypothetical protein [Stenotrophomonas maltophilia]MBH1601865.1 hypothetical protein [Stenotrophomonas maltophilia]
MHRFDPDENPFVADLLRLLGPRRRRFPGRFHQSHPVEGRFSRGQFRTLARVFLSRLYGVDQDGYLRNVDAGARAPVRCSVRVVLDDENGLLQRTLGSIRREQMSGHMQDDARVVVVHVGFNGVTELFSGRPEVLVRSARALMDVRDVDRDVDRELHWLTLGAWMSGAMDSIADPEGRVPPLDGVEARDAYWDGVSYEDDDLWLRHHYQPPRAAGDGGRGRHGGSGGGGDGEGPRGPEDGGGSVPGHGGVMEVLDHPVLFTAAPRLLDDILRDL